ncbi:MAG TPA: dihydrofolate reductase family protein [Actinomycetota bacterium]|nr:dihydrofolate reductase family protein [Actinomycetota bacterium]
MRKLVVVEFLSLDGVYQAPGHPDEDREGGFEHGGWQMHYFDDVMGEQAMKGIAETDAQLFGRKTFEKMAAFWPTAPADDPFAKHLNGVQKYVASTTLGDPEWQPTTVIRDVPTEVAALKQQDGGTITVLGSGNLVQTLMANDLVDEYSLSVFPLTLGGGKRLFADDGAMRKLELVASTPTTTGGLMLTYRPLR